MKVLFLCAGYGTRLQRDLEKDPDRKHLLGLPKALLPVHGQTILDRWLSCLLQVVKREDIFLVCNDHFHSQFSEWAFSKANLPVSNVFNDQTRDNASRLGANRDIYVASEYFGWTKQSSDFKILVIAGDTLFLDDFNMKLFVDRVFSFKRPFDAIVTHYPLKEDKETRLTGILVLEEKVNILEKPLLEKAVDFLEKPEPEETTSRLACPCFYVFNGATLGLLKRFLEKSRPLESCDATGKFIAWLILEGFQVYSHAISGRLDIGALESLIQAEAYYARV